MWSIGVGSVQVIKMNVNDFATYWWTSKTIHSYEHWRNITNIFIHPMITHNSAQNQINLGEFLVMDYDSDCSWGK